jgi:hypothetical protein
MLTNYHKAQGLEFESARAKFLFDAALGLRQGEAQMSQHQNTRLSLA